MTRRSIHHRLLSFLSVIGGLCFLLSDCEKTEAVAPDIQIPAQSQTIFSSGISFEPGQGQSKSVNFTATANWSADVTETKSVSWLDVRPISGGAGPVSMTVSAQPNTGQTSRSARVSISCGNVSKSFTVSQAVALPVVVEVTDVRLNKTSLELVKSASETLVATVKPDDATDKTVSWSSSNTEIASVDQTGKVTALAGGSATITAKAGEKEATCAVTVTVPVESISLDKTSITLEEEQSTVITATVKPDDASDKTVTWTSSNTSVATLSDGRVTALKEGQATITAKAGDQEASCSVTVKKHIVAVTSITLNKTELPLVKGASETLVATVKPDDATDKTVSWSSSNAEIASVDQTGKVTALACGSATITAKAGEKEATCAVTVTVLVESISLDKTSITLEEEQSTVITATVKPDDASDKTVAWTSSNTSVATVSDGRVTTLKEGQATITAKAGDKEATCSVTVKKHIVAVTSITLNKTELPLVKGASETLVATVKPDDATDKTVSWSSSNSEVASVDQTGKVTALKGGNATITAKAGEKEATCAVWVTVLVESISLDKTSITIEEEQSTVITATVKPDDASDKTVTWTSSNTSVATVSEGRVTALKEGQATITAKAGDKEASCSVIVKKHIVAVTSITLNKTELSLVNGASETLVATVKPDDATDKTVSWSSSNTDVASVDQTGKVTALAGGSATITAKAGEKEATCAVTVTVPVESIEFPDTNPHAVEVGKSVVWEVIVKPENATDKTITWSIFKNPEFASVDQSGRITGLAEGQATVKATASNGQWLARTITVTAATPDPVPVESISLDFSSITLNKFDTKLLIATVYPENATDQTVTWSSSDTAVARVDQSGAVTGAGSGTATITASCGGKSATCEVTVIVPVVAVSLNYSSITLEEGQSRQITAVITPYDATDKTVTWTSSNTSVAAVINGLVTAVNEGQATITAKAGDKSASCSVTVKKHIVAVTSITLNKTELSLVNGASETLVATVKPDDATDKTVSWSSSNADVAKVDQTGKVTALASGSATITAKAGEKEATCAVTVTVPVESIEFPDTNPYAVEVGKSVVWEVIVKPENATDKTITWSIFKNPEFASVDQSGRITGLAEGQATVKATASNGQWLARTITVTSATPDPVPVESISLNFNSITLNKFDTKLLIATVYPENATDKTVTWSSSNTGVARVDQSGTVTGAGSGTATITASCGGKSATCEVTVIVPVNAVYLNYSDIALVEGQSQQITVEVTPYDATDQTVAWTSSNTSVATVVDGLVTAVSEGTATITASCGGKSATCAVTVKKSAIPVESVSLNYSSITLDESESRTLTATVYPDNATDKTVTWSSSNTSVATVANGLVTAVGEGMATITASCGGKSATCAVTVTKKVIPVETIFMDESNPSSVYVGSSVVWKAVINPENATDKTITWSIEENPGNASVDQNGRITGLAAGHAIVRATTTNGQWVQGTIQVLSTAVPVESVSLNYSSLTLNESETRTLTATVYPDNATDKTVTWSSSNTSVATVVNGLVSAVSEGTATITASCGGKSATCAVTVTKKVIPVETIFMDESNPSSVYVGSSVVWKAVINPENATDKALVWSIEENPGNASVDQNGRITGLAAGHAIVRATTTNGLWVQGTIQVLSTAVPVESVSLNYSSITLDESESRTLTATVYPDNATDKTVTWSSSNTSVATVVNGLVTAVSEGTATITASCGGKSATCAVTVTKKVIPVETIFMDESNPSSVYVGSSVVWKAVINPANATDKTLIWSIEENPGNASVDQSGRITGLAAGYATIRATTTDGLWVQGTIQVLPTTVPVERITLNKTSLLLTKNSSEILVATINPSDATDQVVVWSSSDESIATVNQSGRVTAVGSGSATITATAGNVSATCQITVFVFVDSIELDRTELVLEVGKTVQIKATVLPQDASNYTLVWKSSNTSYATVSQEGVVTGIKEGWVSITVEILEGPSNGRYAECIVHVVAAGVGGDDPEGFIDGGEQEW